MAVDILFNCIYFDYLNEIKYDFNMNLTKNDVNYCTSQLLIKKLFDSIAIEVLKGHLKKAKVVLWSSGGHLSFYRVLKVLVPKRKVSLCKNCHRKKWLNHIRSFVNINKSYKDFSMQISRFSSYLLLCP